MEGGKKERGGEGRRTHELEGGERDDAECGLEDEGDEGDESGDEGLGHGEGEEDGQRRLRRHHVGQDHPLQRHLLRRSPLPSFLPTTSEPKE